MTQSNSTLTDRLALEPGVLERTARGVPYLSARERNEPPDITLTAMQRDGRELIGNVTALERRANANMRAYQLISTNQEIPQWQRTAANVLWHSIRNSVDVLHSVHGDLTRWRNDLNHHVSTHALAQLANPRPLAEYIELTRRDLREFQMELIDLRTTLTNQRTRLSLEESDALQAQLLPYLEPARPQLQPPRRDDDPPPGAGAIGVQAQPSGIPQGITNCRAGYYASWETQARFFQNGCPINFNVNRRRYTFADGGQVVIQAHTPILTHSILGDVLFAGAVVASVAGTIVTAGAAGAVLVGGTTVVGGMVARPYDATWQGYTAEYVLPGTQAVWGTQYFFGRKTTAGGFTSVTVNGQRDANRFLNFADQSTLYAWESWVHGATPQRSPQFRHIDIPSDAQCNALEATHTQILQQTLSLLNTLAHTGRAEGALSTRSPRADAAGINGCGLSSPVLPLASPLGL